MACTDKVVPQKKAAMQSKVVAMLATEAKGLLSDL